MKDLVTKKRAVSIDLTNDVHHCSANATRSLVQNQYQLDAFGHLQAIGVRSSKTHNNEVNDYFVILDCEVDFEVPISLGRPFFATGRALVDVEGGERKFRLNKEEVKFNICRSMKQPHDMNVVSTVEVVNKEEMRVPIEERMVVETLAAVLMNFEVDFQSDYVETVNALQGMGAQSCAPKKLDLDLQTRPNP
ncbi:hypothetical protein R3W88_001328 [Solanum pinnatisectum]|uniref:Uncharacterized protein n=1 Tax=Solanum pinnatisectum TaxID=50273 RepID=A0AAV9MI75_9SOLN|nr:hypothetical protein R3W88_001328 [Solanum pinnatisectum]